MTENTYTKEFERVYQKDADSPTPFTIAGKKVVSGNYVIYRELKLVAIDDPAFVRNWSVGKLIPYEFHYQLDIDGVLGGPDIDLCRKNGEITDPYFTLDVVNKIAEILEVEFLFVDSSR